MAAIETPLVSVVTPMHNAERFIEDTIKSVQAQTYSNWEMILVDDLSDDRSIEIVNKFRKNDSRIKLIKNKENLGAAKSRNAGTGVSEGRFVAFLDADDLWVEDKLEKQVLFALENKQGFIYSSYQFADEKGEATTSSVSVPLSIDYKKALKNHIIWTSTVLVDVTLVPKKLVIMPDVRRGQDAATWWQILRETGTSAYGIQESLALYRRTNDSLSANKLKAIKRTWSLYRNVEKLSLARSVYSFCFYGYNAVRKRM